MPALAKLGLTVRYFDATGTEQPAIITRVIDPASGKCNLTAFQPAGTTAAVVNILYSATGAPSTWQELDV